MREFHNMASPWGMGMTNNTGPFGARGTSSNPMDGVLPGLTGTFLYDHARRPNLGAYDKTNFNVSIIDKDGAKHHSTAGQLIFLSRKGNGVQRYQRGVSSMNQMLASSEGIERYGGDTNARTNLLEDWVYFGVPAYDHPKQMRELDEYYQTFHIGRRAMVSNIFGVMEKPVRIGHRLWLILRRLPVADELKRLRQRNQALITGSKSYDQTTDATPSGTTPMAIDSDSDGSGTGAPFGEPSDNNDHSTWSNTSSDPTSSLFKSSTVVIPQDSNQKYYWRIEPYASSSRLPPDPALYNTPHGFGAVIYIGWVSGINSARATPYNTFAASAQEATYPILDTPDYLKPLDECSVLDVELGLA